MAQKPAGWGAFPHFVYKIKCSPPVDRQTLRDKLDLQTLTHHTHVDPWPPLPTGGTNALITLIIKKRHAEWP